MSAERNKAVARRYLEEIINRGNFAVAGEILAEDYLNHSAGPGFGQPRAQFLRGIVDMKAAFPDWHVTIEELVAEGDLVVDRIRISATHSGSANGVPASGRRIEALAMHMWRVVDGKLVEGWYATDALPHVVAALVAAETSTRI
ncbi:MAG: ester cyclase [Chloroflexi bacterium]|nr:ester cyclase [Chloroflexota bacterium]MBV9597024.1 ester cyclase [Chloroflexota bacterium]